MIRISSQRYIPYLKFGRGPISLSPCITILAGMFRSRFCPRTLGQAERTLLSQTARVRASFREDSISRYSSDISTRLPVSGTPTSFIYRSETSSHSLYRVSSGGVPCLESSICCVALRAVKPTPMTAIIAAITVAEAETNDLPSSWSWVQCQR